MKICGVTRLEDAEAAVEAGAWAVGLVLWPQSKRACDPAVAGLIARHLKRRAEVVGVVVNEPLDALTLTVDALGLTAVQLHGDEGPTYATELARRTGVKVIKAAPIRARADLQALQAFRTDLHLVDSHRPGMRGGTGETFDWELLEHRQSRVPLILSGGLHADNVEEAIAAMRPFAVDVASGTEAAPGIKDPERVEAFFAAVRAADAAAEAALQTEPVA